MSLFEPCVREGGHEPEVQAESSSGLQTISAVPAVLVNGTLVTGDSGRPAEFAQLASAIDRALQAASAT